MKPVSRVLARELAVTALLLAGVSVVVFAILYLAPGDPLNALGVRDYLLRFREVYRRLLTRSENGTWMKRA